MVDTIDSFSLKETFEIFNKLMLKHYFIDITNYKNLIKYLSEESIYVDEETIQSIEEEFKEKVEEILNEFGSVFIKLNYNAATDSEFLVHKLECFKLEDILILLKGSNKINTNFTIFQNEKEEKNLLLILKKFYDVKQENEFRIFIHKGVIKAISQRHINIFFNYNEEFLNELKRIILEYYEVEIKPFSNKISEYTFLDVLYLDKSKKVKIIDIMTEEIRQLLIKYSEHNYSFSDYFLLFTNWEEILESSKSETNEDLCIMKVIKSPEEIIESPDNINKFPQEIIGEGNVQNIQDIINFLNLDGEK